MLEYLPWSKTVFERCCNDYSNGHFPVLDIELGGMCNLKCVYCDSPDRIKAFTAKADIYRFVESDRFQWLFICGLGEPTFSTNKDELIHLLDLCKKHNVKCSIFTNLTNFNDELFKYVEDEVLYVMFKLDSLKPDVITRLYGNPDIDIDSLQDKIKHLLSLVKIRNNCSNICASIVPTTENYEELPHLIDFCFENNVFPLIGDLEDSGLGKDTYKSLKLSDKQLSVIKAHFPEEYRIPICPSVLCGIHILHDGTVAVDELTGLSCHWFWLEEPKIYLMKKVWEYSSCEDIEKEILVYRQDRLQFVKNKVGKIREMVFGGCGGDIKELLGVYLHMHNS